MIDRAHGDPLRNNNSPRRHWWRQFLGGIGTCVDAWVGLPWISSHSNIRTPIAALEPTRVPAFFAAVLATRLFGLTLKCGL
jgi:hypothetical protein